MLHALNMNMNMNIFLSILVFFFLYKNLNILKSRYIYWRQKMKIRSLVF